MSEDIQDVTEDLSPYLGDAEEFQKAGLFPEGMFKWEVESAARGTTDFDGVKRSVIVSRLRAVAQAHYIDGEFVEIEEFDAPRYKTHNFKVDGDAQQQLLTLYQVVTGKTPTGTLDEKTGRYVINKLQLAESVVGGQAWNTIYHFKPEGKNETYAVLGKKFRRQPLPKYTVRRVKNGEAETEE